MDTELKGDDPVRLGDWRVLSKLGEGGMGSVYLAERSGRHAAVKTLHPTTAHSAEASERFQREYTAARRVRSPFVAEIIDADLQSARPYLAIEYVSGLTLEDHIAHHGPMGVEELAGFGRQLAVGIESMHEVAVTHRDMKPSNVIMTRRGPVIIDFGIALLAESPQLTATNQVVGSPGWTSPEQLLGDRVGTAADVFGWGALMQYAATGSNPFGTGSPQALMYRIAHGRPSDHAIPGRLGEAVSRALEHSPERRPTVAELIEVTDPAEPAVGDRVVPQPASPSRSMLWPAAAVALVAVAVGALLTWQLSAGSDERQPLTAAAIADDPALPDESDSAAEAESGAAAPDLETAASASLGVGEAVAAVSSEVGDVLTVGCPDGRPATLSAAAQWTVQPGQTIELARGCTFIAPFPIATSGQPDLPITVRSAAEPADLDRALITNDPAINVTALVQLNASHVSISEIDLVAQSSEVSPDCPSSSFGWVVGVAIATGMTGNQVDSISATGGYAGVHIERNASNNTVSNSRFEANTMLNQKSGANGIEIFGDRNTVIDNDFSGNVACGEGAAVEIFGGADNTIEGNRGIGHQSFVELHGHSGDNTVGNAIRRNISHSSVGGASFVLVRADRSDGAPNEVTHNTVRLPGFGGAAGLRCDQRCTPGQIVMSNNVVWAPAATIGAGTYSGGSNLLWADSGEPADWLEREPLADGSGVVPNIIGDPDFAGGDPGGASAELAGAFVPSPCSPVVDAARAVLISDSATDAVGRAVPAGAGPDIGAIELQDGDCSR